MTVVVANVGERDLYYNIGTESEPNFCHFERGKPDAQELARNLNCEPGARYIAKALLERLEADKNEWQRCRYPILKTVLDAVTEPIDLLVLVVTDQPEGTKPEHRNRDTLYTGEILKRLIEKDYAGHVKEVRLEHYRLPPTRDQAYPYFGKLLSERAPPETTVKFYASLSGGLPPLNDALQEQAIRLYRDKCVLFEVIPPSEEECRKGAEKGEIKLVSWPFLRDLAITLVKELLGRYDYSGALEVLRTFQSVGHWKPEVEALLKHAESRMNLNFKAAAQALEPYKSKDPYKEWYESVAKEDQVLRLVENYFVVEIRYRNHEYADMLPRIRLFFELGKDLLPSPPEAQDIWKLLDSLQNLNRLAGDFLHQARGVGTDSINQCFRPLQKIVPKENHELLVPTMREIAERISELKGMELKNPYQEINEHIMRLLKQEVSAMGKSVLVS